MATFSQVTFNATRYARGRPTYPRELFDFVFDFHKRTADAKWATAVDLGCGTGQATTSLSRFNRVIGVDPSEKMIEGARQSLTGDPGVGNIEYVASSAEDLHFLEGESVDLIISAQAAHWFDWNKVWPETARVLKSGGSAAFWTYSEFRLAGRPSTQITEYAQGTNPETSLGPHWEQPGRSILDNHLLAVPEANSIVPTKFQALERVFFTGDYVPNLPARSTRPVILRKKMTWEDLMAYFRTWSSLHTYLERYPDDRNNPNGDIAVRFWDILRAGEPRESEVMVEWPVAMILVKKL